MYQQQQQPSRQRRERRVGRALAGQVGRREGWKAGRRAGKGRDGRDEYARQSGKAAARADRERILSGEVRTSAVAISEAIKAVLSLERDSLTCSHSGASIT